MPINEEERHNTWHRFMACLQLSDRPACRSCPAAEHSACKIVEWAQGVSTPINPGSETAPEWCPRRRPSSWPQGD